MRVGILLKNLDEVREFIESMPKCVVKYKYMRYLDSWSDGDVIWYDEVDVYGKNLLSYVVGLNNRDKVLSCSLFRLEWAIKRVFKDRIRNINRFERYEGCKVEDYLRYADFPRLVLYDLFYKSTGMYVLRGKIREILDFTVLFYVEFKEVNIV